MRAWFALLVFLTLGTHGICRVETAKVTEVRNGVVTMETGERVYQIEEHEPWRVGDRAEIVVGEGIWEAIKK